MKEFIDKTQTVSGTPLNRANMLAAQGFQNNTVAFSQNQVIETNGNGEILTITFNANGSITEVFEGEKTITKTTTFANNQILETLS